MAKKKQVNAKKKSIKKDANKSTFVLIGEQDYYNLAADHPFKTMLCPSNEAVEEAKDMLKSEDETTILVFKLVSKITTNNEPRIEVIP